MVKQAFSLPGTRCVFRKQELGGDKGFCPLPPLPWSTPAQKQPVGSPACSQQGSLSLPFLELSGLLQTLSIVERKALTATSFVPQRAWGW